MLFLRRAMKKLWKEYFPKVVLKEEEQLTDLLCTFSVHGVAGTQENLQCRSRGVEGLYVFTTFFEWSHGSQRGKSSG